jgi:hypothetical protein
MLSEIFKPIFKLFMICLAEFMILMFNLNNQYYNDAFKVTVNNQDIYVEFYEQYRRVLIPLLLDARNGTSGNNETSTYVNRIKFNPKMTLNIEEYLVNYKNGDRRKHSSSWILGEYYIYTKVTLPDTRLIIKRKGKVLYDGPYMEDISSYVNEPGRYFLQTTVTRKDNFYTTIKTYMSFNFILEGDTNE